MLETMRPLLLHLYCRYSVCNEAISERNTDHELITADIAWGRLIIIGNYRHLMGVAFGKSTFCSNNDLLLSDKRYPAM
jgi:hypothetical protein